MDFLLNIEQSVSGKQWVQRPFDERMAMTLSQRLEVSELTGRVMSSRGVALDEAASFLNPTLRDLLPDPNHFKGMSEAVSCLCDAIQNEELIAIFGDYDVDGATSSALLRRFLNGVGAKSTIYIPDRLEEGYGPNSAAMDTLKAQGVSTVVTVDCGTTSFEPLAHAASIGLKVIVVDHHEAEVKLPDCAAVINPKRLDEDGRYAHLAAVGVTFVFCVGVNRALREVEWFVEGRKEPDLRHLLDLVALGTVCDVVPLTGLNRAFVIQGLKIMARRGNAGLAALADVAGVNETPEAYHAGFVIGPRVNAGGRVGESYLGANLLSTDNPAMAAEIAAQLDGYNKDRKELEQHVLDEAIAQVDGEEHSSVVMAVGQDWHPGVIGIVASRLKERYSLPACVISMSDGVGHGSGRSVTGVDLGTNIIAARQSGLLVKGGGHAMAAGFTVEEGKLDEFKAFLADRIGSQIEEQDIQPTYKCDGAISPSAVTPALVEELEQVGPFGSGNAQPRFVLSNVNVQRADVVGKDHVRCFLSDEFGVRLKAIAFRALDSELGQALLQHNGRKLHIAGRLKLDTWGGGTSVQLLIDDAAWV
ncbi:Single-stranded-DNA-specific exonuclease recJ [Candidatus Terasakiella magnetica]|uniref:Single-stranded-DNA-specific exonuclease RecJ n=1 Tax=Candidatus Terasakiella magnetica TaxID=1867952 RepID=A0A1C3RC49_9PROT|nr:single-stranded-DNA-specific exonuclease RecJ [Candidatus Terasakiella magnetica]SCA54792.1 Single-stranded-DNA-specific exonuclease recJ [Candidatus Terasakiella magnetica]